MKWNLVDWHRRKNNHDWTSKEWMIALFWPETHVYMKDFSETVQLNKRMFTAGSVILSPSVSPNFLPSTHPPPHFSLDRYIDHLLKPLTKDIYVYVINIYYIETWYFLRVKRWSYTRIIMAKIWIKKMTVFYKDNFYTDDNNFPFISLITI